jgi:methylphosphotriester-DNA--protein-cysteine methyltransferase
MSAQETVIKEDEIHELNQKVETLRQSLRALLHTFKRQIDLLPTSTQLDADCAALSNALQERIDAIGSEVREPRRKFERHRGMPSAAQWTANANGNGSGSASASVDFCEEAYRKIIICDDSIEFSD